MVAKQELPKIKYDYSIAIATASGRHATKWRNEELMWSDFLGRIASTVRTKETAAEYRKMAKKDQAEIKDVGGFVGGRLKGGKRKADSVQVRTLLTLDIDYGDESVLDTIDMLFGSAYAIYSTHKHTPESPRIRFVVPMGRPVTSEEYVAVGKKVAETIGIDYFDDTTYEPQRIMYWPSTSADADYLFTYSDAPWLDPDDVLAKYADWRDPLEWPTSSRQQDERRKMADKQGHPHDKKGLVGAFCRAYSITEAIETFLPDVYDRFDPDGRRWTYVDGSTAGGLIVYDDDLFAYSHHGTDPVGSQLVNSFDLVRIHRFGAQDEDKRAGTPVNKLPSYVEMTEFAQNDELVRQTMAEERLASIDDEFDVIEDDADDLTPAERQDRAWMKELVFSKSGELEATVPNMVLILENAPGLRNKIAFNEFTNRLMVMGPVPWRKDGEAANWTDADDSGLRTYLETVWGIYNRSKTEDAVKAVSEKHRFHPVRDYLDPLEWDGVPRLEKLFIDYLGAEDTELNRAVTRKAFTAGIARIYRPGCKFDYMVTLYGAQGIGKSMLLDRMGKSWFSDSVPGVTGREAFESLQGAWIIEMGELSATRKADVESIKHFISKREDRFRVAYGRHTEEFPRQCIFFGTTNDGNFIKDKTGGRRFWPVTVDADRRKKKWSELKNEEIDQIWAEAKHYYAEGEPLYLDDRLEAMMREAQAAHTEESPWFGMVQEYLNRKLPDDWEEKTPMDRRMWLNDDEFGEAAGTITRDRVCALEVWVECLGNDMKRFPAMDRREINDILRNMPGWKPNDQNQKGTLRFGKHYGVQRAYIRDEDLI